MILTGIMADWHDRYERTREQRRVWRGRLKRGLRNSWSGVALRRLARRAAIGRAARELRAVKTLAPAAADAITLVACMRDEAIRLPDFLRHYRGLGVSRFILIDNHSRDGSRELALDAPDVELLLAEGSYAHSLFGMDWVMAAIGQAGLDRWYMVADIDELLVYDGCEQHGLPELARRLERQGANSLPVMMLDMYGPLPVAKTRLVPGASMIDACPFFDTDYVADAETALKWDTRRQCIHYKGGPRARVFSTPDRPFQGILAKTPFMRWQEGTLYLDPHLAFPFSRNLTEVRGCLLHFKFLYDFHERAIAATEHGQHWKGSSEYHHYRRVLEADPDLTPFYPGCGRYQNSKSLVAAGLMPPIDWEDKQGANISSA